MSSELIETQDARRPGAGARPSGERLYLLVLEGNSSALCPLPPSGALLLGRSPTADVQVQDPSVSRQHARLEVEDEEVRIVDLGSHNGVRLNGEQVVGPQPLQSGDVVTLGDVTLVFHGGTGRCQSGPRWTGRPCAGG